jgi:hypothetical protein
MSEQTRAAVEVYWRLQEWLGFRAGREAEFAGGLTQWSVSSEKTNRWRDALAVVDWRCPRDLAHVALSTIAEARGLSVRDAYRAVVRADRKVCSGVCRADEVPDFDRWLSALLWAVA